jgi:hypothetical protein
MSVREGAAEDFGWVFDYLLHIFRADAPVIQ